MTRQRPVSWWSPWRVSVWQPWVCCPSCQMAPRTCSTCSVSTTVERMRDMARATWVCQCLWATYNIPMSMPRVNLSFVRAKSGERPAFVCLFVCGVSLTSGQPIAKLLPECLNVMLSALCFRPQRQWPYLWDDVPICGSRTQCPIHR